MLADYVPLLEVQFEIPDCIVEGLAGMRESVDPPAGNLFVI